MDIGFEGDFICLKQSINSKTHPDWIKTNDDKWVRVKETGFYTIFANDIRPDAKTALISYFSKKYKNASNIYHLENIVDLVKKAK